MPNQVPKSVAFELSVDGKALADGEPADAPKLANGESHVKRNPPKRLQRLEELAPPALTADEILQRQKQAERRRRSILEEKVLKSKQLTAKALSRRGSDTSAAEPGAGGDQPDGDGAGFAAGAAGLAVAVGAAVVAVAASDAGDATGAAAPLTGAGAGAGKPSEPLKESKAVIGASGEAKVQCEAKSDSSVTQASPVELKTSKK